MKKVLSVLALVSLVSFNVFAVENEAVSCPAKFDKSKASSASTVKSESKDSVEGEQPATKEI